jgi:hypothetical protein
VRGALGVLSAFSRHRDCLNAPFTALSHSTDQDQRLRRGPAVSGGSASASRQRAGSPMFAQRPEAAPCGMFKGREGVPRGFGEQATEPRTDFADRLRDWVGFRFVLGGDFSAKVALVLVAVFGGWILMAFLAMSRGCPSGC